MSILLVAVLHLDVTAPSESSFSQESSSSSSDPLDPVYDDVEAAIPPRRIDKPRAQLPHKPPP